MFNYSDIVENDIFIFITSSNVLCLTVCGIDYKQQPYIMALWSVNRMFYSSSVLLPFCKCFFFRHFHLFAVK